MLRLNKLCAVEDWDKPEFLQIEPLYLSPACRHRKPWEFAQVLASMRYTGNLRSDSVVLGVGAGHEPLVFDLTNHVRWVFATDIYGVGDFSQGEANISMLVSPEKFAERPYNRRRLVVQYMDGRDLLYEDGTFDAVFCASSIEHFGGLGEAQRAIREMERVAKPGGVVAVTTECIVNGKAGLSSPGLELFTPEAILELAGAAEHCAYADGMPPEFTPSAATMGTTYPLASAFADIKTGTVRFPHVVLEHEGREFTSVSIALKKRL